MNRPFKILGSPVSLDEARTLIDVGIDIVDVKNPVEGSLGAQPPGVIRAIVEYAAARGVPTSATLGDLPFLPGTAALAGFGLAHLGLRFIKAGIHGPGTSRQATELLKAIREAVDMVDESITVVAAGYADYWSFGGVAPNELLDAAIEARCTAVMLDTENKQRGTLFDVMTEGQLRGFVNAAHASGCIVALAGSIGTRHLGALKSLRPDIIGIRGALCGGDRSRRIELGAAESFMHAAQEPPAYTGLTPSGRQISAR